MFDKKMEVTTNLVLDKRYERSDGKYPALLRVTYNRKFIVLPVKKSYTEAEWKTITTDPKPGALKDDKSFLTMFEADARRVIDSIPKGQFTFDEFRNLYKHKDQVIPDSGSLESHFKRYEAYLWAHDQVKTSLNYKGARVSFESFRPRMALTDITVALLYDYKFWMKQEGKSKTTLSMYLRALRTIINRALAESEFPPEKKYYPFGKISHNKFKIPAPKSKKNPLSSESLDKLAKYKTDDKKKAFARDMWLFCFYCGGRNYVDILYLKYKNITRSTITFEYRIKTEDTDDKQDPLIVDIHDDLRAILKRCGSQNTGPDTYVLDVLKEGMDAMQIVHKRNDFGKDCNEALSLISKALKIPAIKMQQARHTAFSELRKAGKSMDEIRKIAGHASEKTTQIYMESLNTTMGNKDLAVLRNKKLKAV